MEHIPLNYASSSATLREPKQLGQHSGMRRRLLGVLALVAPFAAPYAASAQLVAPNAVPNGVVPVVFLNGYQLGCIGSSSFQSNFGSADMVLQASGQAFGLPRQSTRASPRSTSKGPRGPGSFRYTG